MSERKQVWHCVDNVYRDELSEERILAAFADARTLGLTRVRIEIEHGYDDALDIEIGGFRPETDQELQKRLELEARLKAEADKAARDQYERLKKLFGPEKS